MIFCPSSQITTGGGWGPCGANVWSISAPEMERASNFLHIASGILKIDSLEAEKPSFLRRQSESIDDWIICNELLLELQCKSYEKETECMVFIQYSCLLPLKFSIVFTVFQISQLPVNRFSKFRMLWKGMLMLVKTRPTTCSNSKTDPIGELSKTTDGNSPLSDIRLGGSSHESSSKIVLYGMSPKIAIFCSISVRVSFFDLSKTQKRIQGASWAVPRNVTLGI